MLLIMNWKKKLQSHPPKPKIREPKAKNFFIIFSALAPQMGI